MNQHTPTHAPTRIHTRTHARTNKHTRIQTHIHTHTHVLMVHSLCTVRLNSCEMLTHAHYRAIAQPVSNYITTRNKPRPFDIGEQIFLIKSLTAK